MRTLKLTQSIYLQILATIGKHSPECGGILGGTVAGEITEFFFDSTGESSPMGYTPDVEAVNQMLIDDWMPRGILMQGIVHSHAEQNTVPSCGDVGYGIRILQALDTVDSFYLPIVTVHNGQMRMDCYEICRDEENGFVCRQVEWDIVGEQKNG